MIYVDSDEIANFLKETGDWFVKKLTHMDGYCCERKLTSFTEGIKNFDKIIDSTDD